GIMRALSTHDPLDALDGFYMDVSKPLASLDGMISCSLKVDLLLFRAGVRGMLVLPIVEFPGSCSLSRTSCLGGVHLETSFGLADPQSNGKLRPSDIITIFA